MKYARRSASPPTSSNAYVMTMDTILEKYSTMHTFTPNWCTAPDTGEWQTKEIWRNCIECRTERCERSHLREAGHCAPRASMPSLCRTSSHTAPVTSSTISCCKEVHRSWIWVCLEKDDIRERTIRGYWLSRREPRRPGHDLIMWRRQRFGTRSQRRSERPNQARSSKRDSNYSSWRTATKDSCISNQPVCNHLSHRASHTISEEIRRAGREANFRV